MASSPENMIKFLKSRRHFYVELRDHLDVDGTAIQSYYCVLCADLFKTNASLISHLIGQNHIRKLDFAKETLLTRNNRWPFSDGILLFDSNVNEELASQDLRTYPTIDNNKYLTIQPFNYEPVPAPLGFDCRYTVYHHDHAQKIGKARVSIRHSSHEIEKVYCEWMGGNDINFEAVDQSRVIKVIVLPYSYGLGRDEPPENNGLRVRQYCAICDKKMVAGKDVASLLHLNEYLSFGQISCCTPDNFRARNRERVNQYQPKDRNKEFHFFHTSCLIHWIMWIEYVQLTDVDGVNDIEDVFCPECNTKKFYTEAQMARAKSMILQAKNEWTKNPEHLQNSSIGFHFPLQHEDKQTVVKRKKSVHFYRTVYSEDYISRAR